MNKSENEELSRWRKTTEPIGSLVYEQMELKKKAKDPHNIENPQGFKARG